MGGGGRMNEERIDELINKVKDEKMRNYLKIYAKYKNPLDLLGIIDYLGIKLNRESIDGIIPKFELIDKGIIILGAVILRGNLYEFMLKIYKGFFRITMFESGEISLYIRNKEEEGEKDEKA
jgi:hypothetical protein